MKRSSLALVLLTLLCACTKEPELVDATEVIISLRSDLQDDLGSVEAAVYDVSGTKPGGRHLFDLSLHPLPFSFTVVPALPETAAFMLQVTGHDPEGTQILQTRVIMRFVPRQSRGAELWLSKGCLGKGCSDGETCTATPASEAGCGAIPTLETTVVIRGQELDGSTVFEVDPAATAIPDAESAIGAPSDAGAVPAAAESGTSDGGPDARTPQEGSVDASASGACLGNAGLALCEDRVLYSCDQAGQVAQQETCESARQCQLGIAGKRCAPCDPGARRCTQTRLERCKEDGSGWELVKTCESEALCNVVAGDCVAGACTATTRVCMNGGLYGCSQDLTQLSLISPCSASLCDQTNGECDVCTMNARTCSGGTFVEACDSRGQNLTRTQCPTATPKCTGSGQCVQCTQPTDCPAPSNPCQAASCNASTARCGSTNRAAHTSCTGGVCNGTGTCLECVDDTDCKTAGARKCSNNRCVPCIANGDCPAGSECTTSQTCRAVSLAGTGGQCQTASPMSGGNCGGFYCGVTQQRLAAALVPSAVCNISASLACSGDLPRLGATCAGMFTADAVVDPNGFRTKVVNCIKANAAAQGFNASDACVTCFAQVDLCCATDTFGCAIACSSGVSVDCDNAKRAANCLSPLYSCSGLPSPL